MTNPQKKVLETWTNLKSKLSKLVYLYQKRSLIKDAVEIYLNQSSSFTSISAQENPSYLLDIPADYQITPLTEPTVPEYNSETNLLSAELK